MGIGTTAPTAGYLLDINGSGRATGNFVSASNVRSSSGMLGPWMPLTKAYFDMVTNTTPYQLGMIDDGNPGLYGGSVFHNGFLNGADNSGMALKWNKALVNIKGCRLGTLTTPSSCTAVLQCCNPSTGSNVAWTSLTSPFTLYDYGSSYGYTNNPSPVFSLANSNAASLGLLITSPASVTYRVGSCSICFFA
jgi:hypothetical protein